METLEVPMALRFSSAHQVECLSEQQIAISEG